MIKGSYPMSKVLVFEGNSYVCWKNEDIRLFYDSEGNSYEGNSYVCWKNEDIRLFYDCTW